MSVSLPSKEIYAVDVPEVSGFNAAFIYNFFVNNESVSDTGGIPSFALERPGSEVDSQFLQYSTTRVPRYVKFMFSLPKITEQGNNVSDISLRNNVFTSNAQNGSLISDNIKSVVTEDHFASSNFVATSFNDAEIDEKIYYFSSGSFMQHTLKESFDNNVGHLKASQKLAAVMPKHIRPSFTARSLVQPQLAHGTTFGKIRQELKTSLLMNYFEQLKAVVVNAQFNGKLFNDMTGRAMKDPHAPFSSDMHDIHKFTNKLKQSVIQRQSHSITEDEFKTFVPFIDVRVRQTSQHQASAAEIVGYIIDKVEVLPGVGTKAHDPIIIDNPKVNSTADFKVKYNTTYIYTVRSVAQFTVPAIDDETGDVATIKVLVSSRPSNKIMIKTVENVAPPPPADTNFTWDYERRNPLTADHDQTTGETIPNTGVAGSLMVHWTFPPNSQRDIKKFQVFRRENTDSPFELVKMYDFDDSILRLPDLEQPDPVLVEVLTSPCTFFFDDDFTKDSKFIYTIAAIDAHGLTSNYSAQFEVSFDRFKNKLVKRLVSHSGAPKPYPNLYLEADAFVDTIRVSGPNSKRMRLYFNPEYYHIQDDSDRFTTVVSTKQKGAAYKAQFTNLDNQESVSVDIKIDDRIRASTQTVSTKQIKLSPQKRIK